MCIFVPFLTLEPEFSQSHSSADDLPAVQVGDPFQEKLLLEATLELSKTDATCQITEVFFQQLIYVLR